MKHIAEISSPTERHRTELNVRVYGGADNVQTGCDFLVKRATLSLDFGPASAQVYPTSQELRAMAEALMKAADDVDSFDSEAWFEADRAARRAAADKADFAPR